MLDLLSFTEPFFIIILFSLSWSDWIISIVLSWVYWFFSLPLPFYCWAYPPSFLFSSKISVWFSSISSFSFLSLFLCWSFLIFSLTSSTFVIMWKHFYHGCCRILRYPNISVICVSISCLFSFKLRFFWFLFWQMIFFWNTDIFYYVVRLWILFRLFVLADATLVEKQHHLVMLLGEVYV